MFLKKFILVFSLLSDKILKNIIHNFKIINKKVFIADIVTSECCYRDDMVERMLELENLVDTFGGIIILQQIQKRMIPDYKTYIWKWKLEEIRDEMKSLWAETLIIWNILKPRQIYNINEILRPIWAQAWDRVDLILKIFERHADSVETKLQIELAAIKHMWPRIYWMGMELSKQAGWIWTRWKWETNTEIMKRHLQNRTQTIRKKLKDCEKVRSLHRKSRKRKNFSTVWIVGYTNAWKSSLMRALTKKEVLIEDKLFATLWTNVWKMYIQKEDWTGKEVLINDTIGFIRDLPPSLIEAFSSTLEDSIESDILLHVVDVSDPSVHKKIYIVNEILENIKAVQPRIYVFNKIDLLNKFQITQLKSKFKEQWGIFISTHEMLNLEELKQEILKMIT